MIAPINETQTPNVPNGRLGSSPFRFSRPSNDAVQSAEILIVDDEPAVGFLVRRYLKDAGFSKFEILNDSSRAVDRILETTPDLVLLDVQVVPENGLKILEAIRKDERGQHVAVVALSLIHI